MELTRRHCSSAMALLPASTQSPLNSIEDGRSFSLAHDSSLSKYRTIFKPETLSHRIKLCGGGSGAFESSVQSLQSLYNFSSMYLPGPSRHAKDTSTPPVLMASTPILSKVTRGDGPRYNIAPVPPSYKLPARMLELLNSGKFCFTEDNFVEYTEIEVKNEIE